jgi:phosphoglycerate dehydrogenase-like enzyme
MMTPKVVVLPDANGSYSEAVEGAGGQVVIDVAAANSLVWTDSQDCDSLTALLRANEQIRWVQLPFAGVDSFSKLFAQLASNSVAPQFTSAKGSYREPVAEHALALSLSLARIIPERVLAKSWGRKFADTLFDANVLIVGGGGIAEELARLLNPFRAQITVLRRHPQHMENTANVGSIFELEKHLPSADYVFVAASLTQETMGLFNAGRFALMKPSAYFINVARGGIVVTADLEAALRGSVIAGAGIDVTDPEPLPTGHALWDTPNLIITPHSADTPEMCVPLLATRIQENVAALISGAPLVGTVNLKLGY